MYYKAKKGTLAYFKITGFLNAIHEQRKQNAKDLATHAGIPFKEYFKQRNLFSLCGKITSIKPCPNRSEFATTELNLSRDWTPDKRAQKEGYPGYYRPNTRRNSGRAILEFIRSQKDYTFEDDNKLYKLKTPELRWTHFGYIQKGNFVLISTQDDLIKFTPLPGMVEITITEYKKLKGKD